MIKDSIIPLELFVSIAKNSTHPKHKHAAFIFCDGELIVYTNNMGNSHAERRAIDITQMLGYRGSDLTLFSIAITKDGKLKLAKPCRNCEYYIRHKNISKVYYSTKNQTIERLEIK